MANRSEKYQSFYQIIEQIPKGKVATYGQIATLAGCPGQARQVGYALNALSEDRGVPWHRVINGRGEISLKAGYGYELQRSLLEAEGVEFGLNRKIDLGKYLWQMR